MTPTTTSPLTSSPQPANPLPALAQPGSPLTQPGALPGKLSLDKPAKRKVPAWYRRSRTFWAGGTIVALFVIGGGLRYKFAGSDRAEEITATVKRANLSITVTERGELESSKTID